MSSDLKKFALVKWIENSQFDHTNEWNGRITSVSHTNIVDYDPNDLRAGMEIKIFRNGEIWQAQVIIPKTTLNAVDLPPSNHKFREIVLPANDSEIRSLEETMQKQSQTFQEIVNYNNNPNNTPNTNNNHDLNKNHDENMEEQHEHIHQHHHHHHHHHHHNHHQQEHQHLIDSNNLLTTQYTPQTDPRASVSLALTAAVTTTAANTVLACNQTNFDNNKIIHDNLNNNSNNNNNNNNNNYPTNNSDNKDWHFIPTCFTDSGCLNEFYQVAINNNNNNIVNNKLINNSDVNNNHNNINYMTTAAIVPNRLAIPINGINVESIVNMQTEIMNQQKEIKSIEIEIVEKVKQLHRSVTRLTKKFDEFAKSINNMKNPSQAIKTAKLAKSSLNEFNNSIHQYCSNKTINETQNELETSTLINNIILNDYKTTSISPLTSNPIESSIVDTTPITTSSFSSTSSSSSSPSLFTLGTVKVDKTDLQQHILLQKQVKQSHQHLEVNFCS